MSDLFSRFLLALTLTSLNVLPAPAADLPCISKTPKSISGDIPLTPVKRNTAILAPLAPAHKHVRVLLVLGGGGTRGAAHVGVLRVLKEEGIPIDAIVGTSMGAIVGGLYSAGVSIDSLENKFDDAKLMKSFMTIPLAVRIALAPVLVIPRLFGDRPYDGLYKGTKFRNYLEASVPECERTIEDLNIPFRAVTLSIVDGKPYALSHGNLGYALQASSAVPGLRKPVQIGNNLFVDGGVVANVPVNLARQEFDADVVIAVNVDERFAPVPLNTFRKIGSVSTRMLKLELASTDDVQLKNADIIIHPEVDGIGLVSINTKQAKKAIQAGETATRLAIPAIKERLEQIGIAAAAKSSEE
jgi:NTE family protein